MSAYLEQQTHQDKNILTKYLNYLYDILLGKTEKNSICKLVPERPVSFRRTTYEAVQKSRYFSNNQRAFF